jgi:cobalt-zinc-cadmium efflux system membrane fusion protein
VKRGVAIALLCALVAAAPFWLRLTGFDAAKSDNLAPAAPRNAPFRPSEAQWAAIGVEPVVSLSFTPTHVTEAKIAVDEDRATPVFSPYAGRVVKLFAKPGDTIRAGQPLFVVEATDMVQAQNDFIAALATTNKAQSQVRLTQTVEKRLHDLYDSKAMSLREWQQAQADLTGAQNDLRAAETTLEAARNRLRILGKTESEITTFQETGRISPETSINAPIGGTIVQRKVGPGQYVVAGSSDPVFVVGDLTTVWLIAYVRETEASRVRVGQALEFTTLSDPGTVYRGEVNYVASTMDATFRRLLVRATIRNTDGLLKPEMFASVTIFIGAGEISPAVPRDAVIHEGDSTRVWVAGKDRSIELRSITVGAANGRMIQVLKGLEVGESVITKGALFIDRAASGV